MRRRLGRADQDVPHNLGSAESPTDHRSEVALRHALRTLCEHHEIKMAEVEQKVCNILVTGVRHRFEALQDDFLLRTWRLGAEGARRQRIAPYAPTDMLHARRHPER